MRNYGYKKVTEMVNNVTQGTYGKVNKKKNNGLLLPKTEVQRKEHTGTGKIISLDSNTRWCLDGFEIRCFNDEKVYVAFSLDYRDREAIHYIASKEALLGKDIQNVMTHSVEKRFNNLKTQTQIEWLSDRVSIYKAIQKQQPF